MPVTIGNLKALRVKLRNKYYVHIIQEGKKKPIKKAKWNFQNGLRNVLRTFIQAISTKQKTRKLVLPKGTVLPEKFHMWIKYKMLVIKHSPDRQEEEISGIVKTTTTRENMDEDRRLALDIEANSIKDSIGWDEVVLMNWDVVRREAV